MRHLKFFSATVLSIRAQNIKNHAVHICQTNTTISLNVTMEAMLIRSAFPLACLVAESAA